jgi:thiamine biosynthesis protein ThiI
MKYIIKVSSEITIKSKFVRKQAIKLLARNIRLHLKFYLYNFDVKSMWDKIEVIIKEDVKKINNKQVEDILRKIP